MIGKLRSIIKPVIRFESFSKKQMQLLTWWCSNSPYHDYNGIIADDSIRAGKTVAMAVSFIIWAMDGYDGQNFAMCGKTVGSFRRNVWTWLKPVLLVRGYKVEESRTENLIVVASAEVEQPGEMGGMFGMEDMDMGGGNAPQISLPAKDKKPWLESKHKRGQPGNAGQFSETGGDGSSNSEGNKSDNDLQKSAANAKMNANNNPQPAPPDKKAYYRKELVGYEARGLGKIKSVSDYACDRIYGRRISVDAIQKALSAGKKYPDASHGGYIYECTGIKVSLTKNCVIKTIWTKETNGLQYGMEDKLERWKAKYGGTS